MNFDPLDNPTMMVKVKIENKMIDHVSNGFISDKGICLESGFRCLVIIEPESSSIGKTN